MPLSEGTLGWCFLTFKHFFLDVITKTVFFFSQEELKIAHKLELSTLYAALSYANYTSCVKGWVDG